MPASQKKKVPVAKFALRLMPSVRKAAESVSLNQFINVAVAEKLAHLQHEEWVARRPKATSESLAKALEILDRSTADAVVEQDKLPSGYVSVRRKYTDTQGGMMPWLRGA
jgi:hypothetical protein